MSTSVSVRTPGPAAAPPAPSPRRRRFAIDPAAVVWPTLLAALNAAAFLVVRPNVGDLQAALARQSAAANGVGLTYWFQWFGGGAAPGNYSVVVPYLSSLISAPLLGALATVAITPLARRALARTEHQVTATWLATYAAGISLWSGRIPFALGMVVAIAGLIGVRERRPVLAVAGIVASSLCSPVTGVFLAFALAAAFLVERDYRRLIFWTCAACGATLLFVAAFFGNPGPQTFSFFVALVTGASALVMLLARPALPVRVLLWCTGGAAVLVAVFPNGMGSNFERLPWLCLPAAVAATATAPWRRRALALLPALCLCASSTGLDLVHSTQPAASAAYYSSLIRQLDHVPLLRDYRLEVVENPRIHTAAYALLGHAALAGGYETQEQNHLNAVLTDPKRLNAISYKIWLDNNAVGYVAFNRLAATNDSPEYRLVQSETPDYLSLVSRDRKWTLYRVQNATPIVAAPQRLVRATQAQLTIRAACACSFAVRVRYSKFLQAVPVGGGTPADVRDDGTGWTVVRTSKAGTYILRGDVIQPLR